jgi:hypothetical protein
VVINQVVYGHNSLQLVALIIVELMLIKIHAKPLETVVGAMAFVQAVHFN